MTDFVKKDLCTILHADQANDDTIDRLLSRRPGEFVEASQHRWLERGRVYERGDEVIAFLAQPYSVSTGDITEILDLCRQHGLAVDISMRSEWNQGQTLGILFWRKELNPFIPPHLLKPGL